MKKFKPILIVSLVASLILISSGIVFAENCSEPDFTEYQSVKPIPQIL
ncbi:hypothetical protein DW1_2947 [Proteiniborus sp. DW1]|nr:hypothetical protein [Proteiniborus sp. DW1]SCG84502.1 hypothetical protein DW1_2947 [Proteiniborus sp. DW1]